MGALFLDGGIDVMMTQTPFVSMWLFYKFDIQVADRVFGIALWKNNPDLLTVWEKLRMHVLQEQEPYGDRRWLEQYPFLQKLTKFEESIGMFIVFICLAIST